MEFEHPLTPGERELFNHCARTWAGDGFGIGYMKVGPLSDELRQRLVALGTAFKLTVTFFTEMDCTTSTEQQFLYATRN